MSEPQDIENRAFQPVVLGGGLDLVTSKFTVYPGSLQDCLNYESSDTGYTRSQGLLFFDGTYDSAIEDMWYIGVQLNPRVDATLLNPSLPFTVGGRATWGTGSSGTVVYWNLQYGASDYAELGLVEVVGVQPAPGDTITDSTTGSELVLDAGMAYPPTTLDGAVHPVTAVQLANTITKYLAYINNVINASVAGQDYVPGSLQFHGKLPGIGATTGGFQYKDDVYGVRDYYSVGFDSGDTAIANDDDVVIITAAGRYRGKVAHVLQASGEWTTGNATGSIVLKPQLDASTAWADATGYALNDLVSYGGIEYICVQAHTSSAGSNEPPDATYWQINDVKLMEGLATLDVITNTVGDQYALVNTANVKYKGALWKATIAGWEAVDTGYSIEYIAGNNVPIVATTPLFLTDLVSNSVIQTAGHIITSGTNEVGGSPLTAWTGVSNITANDATYASCTLAPGAKSNYLMAQIDPTSIPDDTVTVLGIEVIVDAKYSSTGIPVDCVVQLVDTSTGAEQYLSANLASITPLTGTDANYTFGGQNDLWGMREGIDPAKILSGEMYVRVQYQNPDASSGSVDVDYISAAVHYVPIKQKAYVYDGTTDVANLDITAMQIMGGDFGAGNDAYGHMTLYNVSNVGAISNGMLLYSSPLAGGSLIATISSPPSYNMLPSSAEMTSHSSKYENIIANFRETKDGQGAYVATGASPAFMYEGGYFSFIRTPQWYVNDKPRHVAFHSNHLGLGFDGNVIFSAPGVPNDFSAGTGTQWPTGGLVTGLAPLPGEGVLGVWTDRRSMTLVGRTPATDMALTTVADSSGALEYTVQDIGTPFYADFRGISNISVTDKFGDFIAGRISSRVTPFVKDRLQERRSIDTIPQKPVASLTIRNKNQYRLYFEDGWILTMTFFEGKAPEFTLQHYDTATFGTAYVPTFTNSYILRNGRERNIMGTADGSMWIVDGANGIQTSSGLTELDAYIVTNPTNLRRPEGVNKFYHVVLQGQFFGHEEVKAWSDSNYIFETSGNPEDTVQIGDSSGNPVFLSMNKLDSIYASRIADGYSLKLQTKLNGSKPHTLQSLLFRASAKGMDRNRAERTN